MRHTLPAPHREPYRLDQLATRLTELRDEHIELYRRCGDRFDVGRATAARFALSLLHNCTDGEYGQLFEEQPDPYAAEVAR